jgi:hypothetical protein
LEERAKWPLAVVAEQPDLTLEEIVAAMQKRRTAGSRTGVWQLLLDMMLPSKKITCAPRNNSGRTPGVAHQGSILRRRCWR